jgi:hypothetical protein
MDLLQADFHKLRRSQPKTFVKNIRVGRLNLKGTDRKSIPLLTKPWPRQASSRLRRLPRRGNRQKDGNAVAAAGVWISDQSFVMLWV